MQKRVLGKTGEELSIIGFGGIVVTNVETSEAASAVADAVDRGINYFDVAPSYGNAEERLGPALEPYRNGVFLACKTGRRDKEGAAEELRNSLKRMRTDHFDLYQLHGVSSVEDAEKAIGPGGAIETFIDAREKGLVRFLGFSAHSEEAALLLMDQFPFDSVLFPVNYALYALENFGPSVVAKAEEKGIGRLCLKAMAKAQWAEGSDRASYPNCWYQPITDPEEAALALRFTLSQPVTAAIPPGDRRLFKIALDAAENFKPLDEDEKADLLGRVVGAPIFKKAA